MDTVSMGKKYKTKSGYSVQILCIDSSENPEYPVSGLITHPSGVEMYSRFTSDGRINTLEVDEWDLVEDQTLNIKLEVGKKYKTRNGQIVTIAKQETEPSTEYCFAGLIAKTRSLEWWKANGNFADLEHHLDIIEEVKEQHILLPFSLEKAKLGNEVTLDDGTSVDLVSDTRQDGRSRFCVLDKETQEFRVVKASSLKLKPVALVEGKPVLIGDKVIWTDDLEYTILKPSKGGSLQLSNYWVVEPRNLKMPKKTKWVNLSRSDDGGIVAEEYDTKQQADPNRRETHFYQLSHVTT